MRSPDITVLIMVCGLLQDITIAPSLADQTTASQGIVNPLTVNYFSMLLLRECLH